MNISFAALDNAALRKVAAPAARRRDLRRLVATCSVIEFELG
jgi:hypothetical protein